MFLDDKKSFKYCGQIKDNSASGNFEEKEFSKPVKLMSAGKMTATVVTETNEILMWGHSKLSHFEGAD